jgi:hypothetical protein
MHGHCHLSSRRLGVYEIPKMFERLGDLNADFQRPIMSICATIHDDVMSTVRHAAGTHSAVNRVNKGPQALA